MRGALQNLGQTCAVNSLVQIIAHSSLLREAILASPAYRYRDVGKNASKDIDDVLTWEVGDVIDKIYHHKQSISPGGLIGALFRVFKHDLAPGQQHDICELWMLLSSRISEEIHKNADRAQVCITPIFSGQTSMSTHIESKVLKLLKSMYSRSWSQWLQNIVGVELSVVQCNACKDQPWSPEVFTVLPLNININININSKANVNANANQNTETASIEELILQHFELEDIADWSCDKCKGSGGRKQNKLYALPPVLMISLKRFRMSTGGRFSKIHTPVNISTHIKFEVGSKVTTYTLCGIGNHYGSYNFGHYTACVREGNDILCYDDTNVFKVDDPESLLKNNKDAYIICYEASVSV